MSSPSGVADGKYLKGKLWETVSSILDAHILCGDMQDFSPEKHSS